MSCTPNGTNHGIKAVFWVNLHIHFLAIGANGFFIPFIPLTWLNRECGIDAKTAVFEHFLCEIRGK